MTVTFCPRPSPSYFSSQAACNLFSVRDLDYSYLHSEAVVLSLMMLPYPRPLQQMHTVPYHIWKGNYIGLPPWTLHPQTHHLQSHFSSPFSRTVNCLLPSSVLSLLVPGPFLCFLGKTMLGLYYFIPGRNSYQRLLEPGVVFWHSRSHSPQLWKQGGCIKDLVKSVLSSASMGWV